MLDTSFLIGTNPFFGSLIGPFGREMTKWRAHKTENGAEDQNRAPDSHEGQISPSAIGEIEPGAQIGRHPASVVLQPRARAHFRRYILRKKRRGVDYLKTLKKAASFSAEDIEAHHLPYRFFFFKRNGEAFLDLVRFGQNGREIERITKNVTEDDFDAWIDDVREGKGMYVDTSR